MNAVTDNKQSRLAMSLARIRRTNAARTPETLARELARALDTFCNEWDSIADFIAQPEADPYLVAEVYHYAPEFVRQQPRWPEIESDPQWQVSLARPKRKLPMSSYRVPAYYLETLLASGAGKTIANCLEKRGLKAEPHFDRLVARGDQSIDAYLADHETRPEWLEHFSKSSYMAVRLRVAQNEHTSPAVLRVLCVDKNPKIVQAATSHPKFPADAAQLVAAAEEEKVAAKLDNLDTLDWKSLCEFFVNPELPGEMLAVLAQRDDPSILFACSIHPNAPESVWRKSLAQTDAWQRAAVALNPSVPESVLRELAATGDFDIAFALACNPRLPEDVQLALAENANRAIRHQVADTTRSFSVWAQVAKHEGPKTIKAPLEHFLAAAIDPKTPAKKLKAMHTVTNRSRSDGEVLATAVSHAIALHPNFPPQLLAEYRYYLPWFEQANRAVSLMALEGAQMPKPRPYDDWKLTTGQIGRLPGHVANHMIVHGDVSAQRTGCGHERCNRALLIPLLFSTDINTVKKLAARERMPRFFYEILWATNPDSVRKILHANPGAAARKASFKTGKQASAPAVATALSATVVTRHGKIKISGDKKARIALADNSPDLATLAALAQDKMSEVRSVVASNRDIAADVSICMTLASDPESSVRRSLAANRKLPWEVVERLTHDVDPEVVMRSIRWLANFPAELTDPVERRLLTSGAKIAMRLAEYTANKSLQLQLAVAHGEQLASNRHCTPEAATALLRHGAFDLRRIGRLVRHLSSEHGLDAAAAFLTKAVPLALEALRLESTGSLDVYESCFRDAGEAEKAQYQERAAAFLARSRSHNHQGLKDAYSSALWLLYECKDAPAISDLIVRLLDDPTIPSEVMRDTRAWLIGACSKMPVELLRRFAAADHEDTRIGIAGRKDLPEDLIALLRVDKAEGVRAALAASVPDAAPFLAGDSSESVRRAVANCTDRVELQNALAEDASAEVVRALAENEHCRPEVLERLARHRRTDIREAVASNEATPAHVLTALLDDVSPGVRYDAEQSLAAITADRDIQLRLAESRHNEVLSALAMNGACHTDILERLAQHADAGVVTYVAANPNLPAAMEARLAAHPLRSVREAMQHFIEKRRGKSA